ncbi:hypothetical protein DPMN_189033 [Dreissena polymorpha]|uniref:Uncharacterized protein n=1 Tax=Dreissena polymorpha TaxID=45954 RepID=A0A9D4DTC3_DREPO|nr:hypothetical protein DPMN_189033 [Dreissena polymorpha]
MWIHSYQSSPHGFIDSKAVSQVDQLSHTQAPDWLLQTHVTYEMAVDTKPD